MYRKVFKFNAFLFINLIAMKKIRFKIDEKTYNEAKKLTEGKYKLFSNFSELVRIAIREEYKKVLENGLLPGKVFTIVYSKRD